MNASNFPLPPLGWTYLKMTSRIGNSLHQYRTPWLMYCVLLHVRLDLLSYRMDLYHLVDHWNQSGRDPCSFSYAIFCWLEWYLCRDSTLRCLGGRQLWLTWSVPASRSSVHAPSQLLQCGCPVDPIQLFAQASARPAPLAVCSDKLSSAKRYLSYQRNQPAFPCTGWVRTSWWNPVWSALSRSEDYGWYLSWLYPGEPCAAGEPSRNGLRHFQFLH